MSDEGLDKRDVGSRYASAHARARKRLIAAHRNEFDHLVREERIRAGLPAKTTRERFADFLRSEDV